jgi:hypothetical protein
MGFLLALLILIQELPFQQCQVFGGQPPVIVRIGGLRIDTASVGQQISSSIRQSLWLTAPSLFRSPRKASAEAVSLQAESMIVAASAVSRVRLCFILKSPLSQIILIECDCFFYMAFFK